MSKICAWIGHKYQARFDTTPGYFTADDFPPHMLIDTIKHLQKKVYVHDICARCGSVVTRSDKS